MKKLIFITFISFFVSQLNAQHKNIYVSQEGGTSKLVKLGKVGFNQYYFANDSDGCDTLICKGSGLISCAVHDDMSSLSSAEKDLYEIYNKAIRVSKRKIKKKDQSSGEIKLVIKNQEVLVRYFDYLNEGNVKMEIIVV